MLRFAIETVGGHCHTRNMNTNTDPWSSDYLAPTAPVLDTRPCGNCGQPVRESFGTMIHTSESRKQWSGTLVELVFCSNENNNRAV